MELKDIKAIGETIPLILKIFTTREFPDSDFYFAYGQEEYTKDLKKVIKQFKRQFKKTFRSWQ